ncbi:MAG TPA: type II toxin-antitoxin system VapC family toxin [Stellaceae bacterium]|jgi:ribonuclease VapC
MIVIDSSAVIAMMLREPAAAELAARLAVDSKRAMSIASYLEAGTVLAGRRRRGRLKAIDDLDAFLAEAGIDLEPVDVMQGRLALRARIAHGRGMGHGGTLNFGDAFSYALAKMLGAPLLFVGNDFFATDIIPALPPAEA